MPRPTHERQLFPRLALSIWIAWITLAVVASTLPFFVEVRLWTPNGHAFWACEHGAITRANVHRATVRTERHEDRSLVAWNPGTSASIDFEWGTTHNVEPKPARTSRPFVRRAPPWAVLLMPTLLVILLARPARWFARQLPTWLARLRDWQTAERRALLAAGRVPCPSCDYDITGLTRCPACQYDATGLEVCPECGAAVNTVG